jgi:hypothetical protein
MPCRRVPLLKRECTLSVESPTNAHIQNIGQICVSVWYVVCFWDRFLQNTGNTKNTDGDENGAPVWANVLHQHEHMVTMICEVPHKRCIQHAGLGVVFDLIAQPHEKRHLIFVLYLPYCFPGKQVDDWRPGIWCGSVVIHLLISQSPPPTGEP